MKTPNIIFILAAMLGFATAAAWPLLSLQPFPIPSLRPMVELPLEMRALQALLIIGGGLWLLVNPLQKSIQSLQIFQVASAILAVLGFVRFGVPFGAIFCGFFLVAMQLGVHIKRRELASNEDKPAE